MSKSKRERSRCAPETPVQPRHSQERCSSSWGANQSRRGCCRSKRALSLETPIGDEEDSRLGDFIEDKNAILPLDAAIQSNSCARPRRACWRHVTPREERILRMRFGIGMNKDHTLEEVGQQFRSRASASARSRPRRCGS